MVKILLIILLYIIILWVFAVAPAFTSSKKKAPFTGRNFAHRGLYEKDQSIPENCLEAFKNAVGAGYGMELDVQLSLDGQVVVFHDDDLKRACGVDKRVDEVSFEDLRKLKLFNTDHRIPLFSEVLSVVNGKEPLIVELKNGRRNKELCEKTLALLNDYDGEYCIESFNPLITAWFRVHAPKIMRGFLSQMPEVYVKDGLSPLVGAILGRSLLNFLARPDFIAHKIGKRTVSTDLALMLGAIKTGWTSHDPSSEKDHDIVIFEHYRPEIRFRNIKDREA